MLVEISPEEMTTALTEYVLDAAKSLGMEDAGEVALHPNSGILRNVVFEVSAAPADPAEGGNADQTPAPADEEEEAPADEAAADAPADEAPADEAAAEAPAAEAPAAEAPAEAPAAEAQAPDTATAATQPAPATP